MWGHNNKPAGIPVVTPGTMQEYYDLLKRFK